MDMLRTDSLVCSEEPETVEQPSMRWMTVDFMRLQRNNQQDESRAESRPTCHP